MNSKTYVGVDMGGTHIRAARVHEASLSKIISLKVPPRGTEDQVLQVLYDLLDQIDKTEIAGIGIVLPGLVDSEQGVVFDVANIPAWKEVALQKILEERYSVPVRLSNDANCFALGEYHFGKGNHATSLVGLSLGTGLGTGIIVEGRVFSGKNGAAGEFGMIEYLNHNLEYYCSGQFFSVFLKIDGEEVFKKAQAGDPEALKRYSDYGFHLGNAVKFALYALNPEVVVFGGSIRHAFPYFEDAMRKQIRTMSYDRAHKDLKIEVSELENSAILGAAMLCYS